jgi:hypothetical protein
VSDVSKHLLPLGQVGEMFSEDVRTHVVGATMSEFDMAVGDGLMQELYVNPMSPTHATHGGILSRGHDTDCSGIIFHELGFHASATQRFPELQSR